MEELKTGLVDGPDKNIIDLASYRRMSKSRISEEERVDVYTELYDNQKNQRNQKKQKISQKNQKRKKLKKDIYRGLMITGVTLLTISSSVATRVCLGKNNISGVLGNSPSIEWFDEYRYFGGNGKLYDCWHNEADYYSTLDSLVKQMVNDEGISADLVAIELSKIGFSISNVNDALANNDNQRSTFLGRMGAGWKYASYDETKAFESEFVSKLGSNSDGKGL